MPVGLNVKFITAENYIYAECFAVKHGWIEIVSDDGQGLRSQTSALGDEPLPIFRKARRVSRDQGS